MSAAALLWFKRDLRVRDHAPLAEALKCERALALVLVEPAWLASPECDPRHAAFLLACVAELQHDLAALGLPLRVCVGDMPQVLGELRREFAFSHLFSHEETGPGWSWTRDRAVADWCRQQGVRWTEWPQTGVVRRLRSRSGWAARWTQRMNAPEVPLPRGAKAAVSPLPLPTWRELGLAGAAVPAPAAGERAAWATLRSFLAGRGRDYRRAMSSPLSAADACSRLSAHLAFGTISMRCVHQATEAHIASTDDRTLAHALRGFASRLRWHCHFMQKLEDEPAIEWRNLARSVDGLRAGDGVHPGAIDGERLQAWCEGRTGYPMVDACMRQLRATGWLNFRMRAMLVSFAAYHLGLHWREPGLFLARQFLDFEPGIHWCQMQMQVGHHRHQHAAHLFASQAGARSRSAGPVRAPLGAGVRHARLPATDRRRAHCAGRHEKPALCAAPDAGCPVGSRSHPAQARFAPQRPATHAQTARLGTGRGRSAGAALLTLGQGAGYAGAI